MTTWSGYIALGTISGTTFLEISPPGYTRLPFTFGPLLNGFITGTGQSMQFAPVTGGTAWSHDGFGFYAAQAGGSPILIYPHPTTITVNPGQYQIVNPARIAVNSVDWTTASGVALNAAQVAALLGQGGNLVAAAAGTNQATALLIGPGTTIFTNVASGTGTILSPALGVVFRLVNRGANPLLVYPPVGAAIDNNAANAAVMVAAMGTAEFLAVSSSQIYAF